MKAVTIFFYFALSLLLELGVQGRARVLRQTDWEDFEPWRPLPDLPGVPEIPSTEVTQPPGPVVDGSGALLGCNCPAPPQFNPVCGSDGVTYGNMQKLACAQSCGRDVRMAFVGSCARG